MGQFTEWNEQCKNLLKKGFRCIYSSLDYGRLRDELVEALMAPPGQKNHPDRFDVFVNNEAYQKAFRGSDTKINRLRQRLEDDLLRVARKKRLDLINSQIRVSFISSATLERREIRVRARVSEEDEIMTELAPSAYQLRVVKPPTGYSQPWKLEYGKRYCLGREESCEIRFRENTVSNVHAEIEVTPKGEVFLADKGSSNKTYLNDDPNPLGDRIEVRPGDLIRLAKIDPVVLKLER